jgi:hypothetical protein
MADLIFAFKLLVWARKFFAVIKCMVGGVYKVG